MLSAPPEIQKLLQHYAGQQQLETVFARPNWKPPHVSFGMPPSGRLLDSLSDSFGKKQFKAGICFVDMIGFSEEASSKPPQEVATLVGPFLRAVIAAATENKCIVDKTMGDEVMVVMPMFSDVQEPLTDMFWFLADVVRSIEESCSGIAFRSGAAFGDVFLENIQTDSYQEWSLFGNCVNGAKRLQNVASELRADQYPSKYKAVVGAIDSEAPSFHDDIREWCAIQTSGRNIFTEKLPLTFIQARLDCEFLKGVGKMCFLDTFLNLKPEVS